MAESYDRLLGRAYELEGKNATANKRIADLTSHWAAANTRLLTVQAEHGQRVDGLCKAIRELEAALTNRKAEIERLRMSTDILAEGIRRLPFSEQAEIAAQIRTEAAAAAKGAGDDS